MHFKSLHFHSFIQMSRLSDWEFMDGATAWGGDQTLIFVNSINWQSWKWPPPCCTGSLSVPIILSSHICTSGAICRCHDFLIESSWTVLLLRALIIANSNEHRLVLLWHLCDSSAINECHSLLTYLLCYTYAGCEWTDGKVRLACGN